MTSQKYLKDFQPGEKVTSFFVLRKKEMRSKRDSEELYALLELGDASGRIKATVWDEAQKTYDTLTVGEVVKVQAKAVQFGERVQLNIERIRMTTEKDDVDLRQLVPVVPKDRRALFAELDQLIASVQNTFLRNLLEVIFQDEKIRKAFGDAPGGKLWHHAYIGGLLEHTLSVTQIAEQAAKQYSGVNRDLLVTAGLLHDIGKISSYSYRTVIDFTDEGRLLGHIVIGAQMVTDKIKALPDFPKQLAKELLHLILSHQGKLEQASPVVPMTLEALLLYYADEIDSKANAFLRIQEREKKPGRTWSSYVNLMNQYFYFGEDED